MGQDGAGLQPIPLMQAATALQWRQARGRDRQPLDGRPFRDAPFSLLSQPAKRINTRSPSQGKSQPAHATGAPFQRTLSNPLTTNDRSCSPHMQTGLPHGQIGNEVERLSLLIILLLRNQRLRRREGVVHRPNHVAVSDRQACRVFVAHRAGDLGGRVERWPTE